MLRRLARISAFLPLIFIPAPASAASLSDAHRLYFSGQAESALNMYRSLMTRHPSAEAALNAATVAQELGRHKQALGILEGARKSVPGNPDILSQLAWAYFDDGQIAAALRTFREYEAVGDPVPNARLGRALAEMESGNAKAAGAGLESLAADEPKYAIAQFYAGVTREQAKKPEAAIEMYENAIRADSHFVESRLRLGPLFESLKKPDDAWRQYVRMSYSDPKNTIAGSGMARLASRITKKPQEIVPPKKIAGHTRVPPVPGAATLPVIRVGIGSSGWGEPTGKKTLSFRASHPFTFVDAKTGEEFLHGDPDQPWSIHLSDSGKAEVTDPVGTVLATFTDTARLRLAFRENGTFILNTLTFAPGTAWGGMADKEFRGDIEVRVDKKARRLIVVNVLSVEEYLYGVLAAEMPVAWPLEALKAQAVMARNVALYRSKVLKLHKKHGYDLCDEQHCQVYTGVGVESEKVRTAVDATRGRVLMFDGNICHTVFSSNCGGVTQSGTEVGWGNVPYWKSISESRPGTEPPASPWEWRRWLLRHVDVYCRASQYVSNAEYRWTRVVPAETLAAKIAKKRKIGRVKQIHIMKRARSGRIQQVRLRGTEGEIILSREDQIRHYLGLGSLRSNLFTVQTVVRNNRAERFIFHGSGWGHGVGFCQSGASGRAEDGASYEEILAAYFPGTRLR